MTYSQYNPSLIATPSATLNYSIGIHRFDPEVSKVALSATSTVPGVTVALTPKEFTFVGEHEGIILAISVDQSVNSSNVPIEIIANTSIGSAKFPLTFTLEKGVVVVQTLVNGLLIPTTIHVSVGQTVTWLDVIGVDDDGNGPSTSRLRTGRRLRQLWLSSTRGSIFSANRVRIPTQPVLSGPPMPLGRL